MTTEITELAENSEKPVNPGIAAMQKANEARKAAGLPVGRPKGAANKLTNLIRSELVATYEGMGGSAGFLKWAKKNPTEFYRLMVRSAPKERESNLRQAITVVLPGASETPRNNDRVIDGTSVRIENFQDLIGDAEDAQELIDDGVPFNDPITF